MNDLGRGHNEWHHNHRQQTDNWFRTHSKIMWVITIAVLVFWLAVIVGLAVGAVALFNHLT